MNVNWITIYSLILDTLTAIGTVGAVITSLWITFRKKDRFFIRDVKVRTDIRFDDRFNKTSSVSYLLVSIENFEDVKMEVFNAAINIVHPSKKKNQKSASGFGIFMAPRNQFIQPKSIYEIQVDLVKEHLVGIFSKGKNLTLKLTTSFGDKEIAFPEEWKPQLYDALESSHLGSFDPLS